MADSHRTVYFDLETGGLDPLRHPIIQIAAVVVDSEFTELESFEVKVQVDEASCDPEAMQVNEYDAAVWAVEAVPPSEAAARFASFLSRHATVEKVSKAGRPYKIARLAGYNAARFDGPFLRHFFKQQDRFLPGEFQVRDVMHLAIWYADLYAESWPRFSLDAACESLGLQPVPSHDALVDTRQTVMVAKELARRLR